MGDRFVKGMWMAALAVAVLWVMRDVIRDLIFTYDAPRVVVARGDLAEGERTTIAIFERAAPSVAYIVTQQWPARKDRPSPNTGSGVLWDAAGHVVTNDHVIADAQAIYVTLDRGEPLEAKIVGRAPDYDLAVLRLVRPPGALPPIAMGRSATLRVGQRVFAIGNPFGLSRTLTTGIVSALDRTLQTARGRDMTGVIQVDAAINPGNSGGPLLDSSGRLIGITTAIVSDSGTNAGVGMAVPVDVVNRVVPRLIRDGKVPIAGIGILAADTRLTVPQGIRGVAIARVLPGSNASRAGLVGYDAANHAIRDVITHVNGTPVMSLGALAKILAEIGIGNRVTLTVTRDGKARQVTVTVADVS